MLSLNVSRESPQSLQLQVVNGLRHAIDSNSLGLGERLPPSRTLASDIGVSRNLVTAAYEQLTSEGYLEATVGRGTFVASRCCIGGGDELAGPPPPSGSGGHPTTIQKPRYDFTPGRPDLGLVPTARWNECLKDGFRQAGNAQWGYGPAEGDRSLRAQAASWLHRIRGLAVHPDRLVITSGTSESLRLLAMALRERSLMFHSENPSIPYARKAFTSCGSEARTMAADSEGPIPPVGSGIAYLTPSNRFPRGGVLPAGRRGQFLDWAAVNDGLILEDDYDAEFHYGGAPVEPMVRHDFRRVVYLGTFSKSLFPGIRIGYMIVPDGLREAVYSMKSELLIRSPLFLQKALARFLERGYLDRHVLKMKQVYMKRRDRIAGFLNRRFTDEWEAPGLESGFHLSVRFLGRRYDGPFFTRLAGASIALRGENHYSLEQDRPTDRLVLGYGNIRDDRLEEGLEALAGLIRRV